MEKVDGQGRSEVLCRVCGDKASGKHYGVASCDGCRGFFKRSIRRNLDYVCKESNSCIVDVTRRNQCQACRFRKCLQVNMKRDAVQHERAPRSTSNSMKPKYIPCYPYYLPFKSTFYSSPLFGSIPSSAPAATTGPPSKYPFEVAKFDLIAAPLPSAVLPGLNSSPPRRTTQFEGLSMPKDSLTAMVSNSVFPPPLPPVTATSPKITLGEHEAATRSIQTTEVRPNPPSDSTSGMKEDEVSSSGTELQASSFMINLNLLNLNESIYESAAKLLFLSIKWARSIPSFLNLPFKDQTQLLEEAWPELFILSASQWSLPIDDTLLCSTASSSVEEAAIAELRHLRDALAKIASMRLDHTELACLKALALFKPENRSLQEPLQVEVLQDQTQLMLQEYCLMRESPNKIRYGKLLLLLACIRRISGRTLREIFFKQTVGDVPIEHLIADMFKTD